MSRLVKLHISGLRNITELLQLDDLAPGVNLIHGENASGKTSLLEAIHLLASGRSFRTSRVEPLIADAGDETVIHAEFTDDRTGSAARHRAGFRKRRRQPRQLSFNGEQQRNWDTVARELPVQILDAHSFGFLDEGPKARRRFLDWGVFHVEPSFVANWRKTRKCVANRNSLLRQARLDVEQLAAWDRELCRSAEAVHEARASYFQQFLPVFAEVYGALAGTGSSPITLEYQKGWDDRSLSRVLVDNRAVDVRHGMTRNGPHRADILVKQRKRLAVEVLSRGQQKLFVSALKVAQGILLSRAVGRRCIFLADDLPAELDPANRIRVLDLLKGLGSQLFISCVEPETLEKSLPAGPDKAMFHMEHGRITD